MINAWSSKRGLSLARCINLIDDGGRALLLCVGLGDAYTTGFIYRSVQKLHIPQLSQTDVLKIFAREEIC